ncbi:DUF6637 family protein [Lachnospiraceae bacterium 62-35]
MFPQEKKKNPRNTTVFLDVIHIVLGAVIVVLAVLSFLNPEDHMIMFPVIFLLGAVLNLITGFCHIRGKRDKKTKRGGIAQILLGLLLVLLSAISAVSIWRW